MKEKTKVEVEYVGNEDEIKDEMNQVCLEYDDDIKFKDFAKCKLRKLTKTAKRIAKSRFGKTLGIILTVGAAASVGGVIAKKAILNDVEADKDDGFDLVYDEENDTYTMPTEEDETTVTETEEE